MIGLSCYLNELAKISVVSIVIICSLYLMRIEFVDIIFYLINF